MYLFSNWDLGLPIPPKLAQKDENCELVKNIVDLLLSQYRTQYALLTSDVFFPQLILCCISIFLHIFNWEYLMESLSSCSLFLLLTWGAINRFGELSSPALHFCILMTSVMLLACLLLDDTKTFYYLYLIITNCSAVMLLIWFVFLSKSIVLRRC